MGWPSCHEDNIDARGEYRNSKSRQLKVPNRREPRRKQDVSVAKTRHVPEEEICFESLLNNLPEPSRPAPKDNIDARGESKQPKTLQPKPSPKMHQRSRRREPRRKQEVPVAKTWIGKRDESKQPKTLQPKPSPKPYQRSHRNVPVIKTRYVPPDEIQRRIQLEIIRQDEESKGIYPH